MGASGWDQAVGGAHHGEVAGGPVDVELTQQFPGQGHLVGGSVVGHVQPLHVLHQRLLVVLLPEQVIALSKQVLHQLEQKGLPGQGVRMGVLRGSFAPSSGPATQAPCPPSGTPCPLPSSSPARCSPHILLALRVGSTYGRRRRTQVLGGPRVLSLPEAQEPEPQVRHRAWELVPPAQTSDLTLWIGMRGQQFCLFSPKSTPCWPSLSYKRMVEGPAFAPGPGSQAFPGAAVVPLLSHVQLFSDPMDCSTPGFSVILYLPAFAQIHIH